MYFSLDLLSIQTLLDQLLSRPSLEVTSPVTLVTLVDICPLWVVRNPQSLSLRITATQVSSLVFIIYLGLYT